MKIALCLLVPAALSLAGCLKTRPSECHSTVLAPVLSVSGSKTVAVNQPATYALGYELQSSCGKLSGVSEEGDISMPDTHFVSLVVEYNDCNCPQITIPSQTNYTFVPTKAGTYYFKFRTANSFLSDTLVVK